MHSPRVSRIAFALILLAIPFLQASGCGKTSTGPPAIFDYTLNWVFVNASTDPLDANLEFAGIDAGRVAIRRTVGGNGGAASGQTVTPYSTREIPVSVSIAPGGRADKTSTVVVIPDEVTTITAVWDGSDLEITSSPGSAQTWVLSGPRTVSGSWQETGATAHGTLSFFVPLTVQEGTTVPVRARFSGDVDDTQWDPGNPLSVGRRTGFSVGIVDRGAQGFNVSNGGLTERAQPRASAFVEVSATWTIPSNPTTLSIEAGGGFAMAGAPLNLVATYRKVQ